MAWRGRDTALECKTIEEFTSYLRGLDFVNGWRPAGMVLHNTASPTLYQWWHSVPPAQRMENLISYYRDEMGWSAGPHAFVDGESIWVLTDFNVSGVHSPSWNGTRLGIEMVGDYDTESDESGMGAKVMEMTVALFGECHAMAGWEPSNNSIKLHKEDPATDHDCPGKNIVKSEFISDVTQYMGDGGDHLPPEPPAEPRHGTVVGLVPGDTLNIRAAASSSAPIIGTADEGDTVIVVGEVYNGSTKWFRLQFGDPAGTGVAIFGWASSAYIEVEGEAPGDEWHEDITATVFASADDPQDSAYGSGPIDGNKPGIALPYKWRDGPPPKIRVKGPKGEQAAPTVDVGPWNTDNPEYVLDSFRPMVEQQFAQGTTAQNGMVPTNDAAIDLTPNTAKAVGISGKGKVSWRFE
jgi:Bacterial SH3 domain/N-acetylmuramoyl-L-alanine amidase